MPSSAAEAPQPAPDAEAQFVALINNLRSSNGAPVLSVDGPLTAVARRWASTMADQGHISHNPSLASDVTGAWIKLGENVGVGPDVQTVFRAFVASPEHYRNLLDPGFSRVGVGVVRVTNGIYTTHDFEQLPAAAPRPAAVQPHLLPTPSGAATPPTAAPRFLGSWYHRSARSVVPAVAVAPLRATSPTPVGNWVLTIATVLAFVTLAVVADRMAIRYLARRGRQPTDTWLDDRLRSYGVLSAPAPVASRLAWRPTPAVRPAVLDLAAPLTTPASADGPDDLSHQLAPYDITQQLAHTGGRGRS